MTVEDRIASDMRDFVAATAHDLRTERETAHAVAASLTRGELRDTRARNRLGLAWALGLGVIAATVPIPYRHEVIWEASFQDREGRLMRVQLPARDEGEAARRARALREVVGTDVAVASRVELVWATVYAMARDKLFRIDVESDGKSDAEAEQEIREQLAWQGWVADTVVVRRENGKSSVEVTAEDGEGRRIHLKRMDEDQGRIQMEPEALDKVREPGMTDEQLREKILNQLRARGLDAEVTVKGDRIGVRIMRKQGE